MKDNVYCLYDRLSNRYVNVFSSATDATAKLQFEQLFKQSPEMQAHYDLCRIGSFSIESGELTTTKLLRIDIDPPPSGATINAIEKALD